MRSSTANIAREMNLHSLKPSKEMQLTEFDSTIMIGTKRANQRRHHKDYIHCNFNNVFVNLFVAPDSNKLEQNGIVSLLLHQSFLLKTLFNNWALHSSLNECIKEVDEIECAEIYSGKWFRCLSVHI